MCCWQTCAGDDLDWAGNGNDNDGNGNGKTGINGNAVYPILQTGSFLKKDGRKTGVFGQKYGR